MLYAHLYNQYEKKKIKYICTIFSTNIYQFNNVFSFYHVAPYYMNIYIHFNVNIRITNDNAIF